MRRVGLSPGAPVEMCGEIRLYRGRRQLEVLTTQPVSPEATVPPMTLEAEVLHYADNASAKTTSMADSLEDADNFQGNELISARDYLAPGPTEGVSRPE